MKPVVRNRSPAAEACSSRDGRHSTSSSPCDNFQDYKNEQNNNSIHHHHHHHHHPPPPPTPQTGSCFKMLLLLLSVQMVIIYLVAMKLPVGLGDMTLETRLLRFAMNHKIEFLDEFGSSTTASRETKQTVLTGHGKVLSGIPPGRLREGRRYAQDLLSGKITTRQPAVEGSRSLNQNETATAASLPYLLVGGSDGSGTRSVVHTLMDLGANFHVDDRRTMDVHGTEMFHGDGWPPLVNLVMNTTQSADYELTDLTKDVLDRTRQELTKLKSVIDRKAAKKRPTHRDNRATSILVGIKAPVSMLLLPLFREVFGPIKFLHVVRDGRDVSMSENQTPVQKFYNTFYGLPEEKLDARRPPPITNETNAKAMQLWNDWNLGVMNWGLKHVNEETFDYLTIRTEDLVNPETKLESLLLLSDFIGSDMSFENLCCMSQKRLKDFGKSTAGVGAGGNKKEINPLESLTERFGAGRIRRPEKGLVGQRLSSQGRLTQDLTQLARSHSRVKNDGLRNALRDKHAKTFFKKGRHLLETKESAAEINGDEKSSEFEARDQKLFLDPLDPRKGKGDPDFFMSVLRHRTYKKESSEKVQARYGKWARLLEHKPDLSARLHELGAAGLKAFGYEPAATFLDPPDDTLSLQCAKLMESNRCGFQQ